MGRFSIIVVAGLVAFQGYSLDAVATAATICPVLGPGAAFGDPDQATRIQGTTPILVLSPDGRLSVDIEGGSLACVLQELGRQGDIMIVRAEPAGEVGEIWRKFADLPVFHGVRRLLGRTSYVLIHSLGMDAGAAPRVMAIWLLRGGPERFGSDEKLADMAAHDRSSAEARPANPRNVPDPTRLADRLAGLERLAERNMESLSEVLWQTLESDDIDDAALRDLALARFNGADGQPPAEVLAAMFAAAPTARLRRQALDLLAEVSQELSFDALMQAIGDPDPAISGPAGDLYADLRIEALVDAVARAVEDDDWRVRQSALETLEEMHEFAPVGQLAALAANDPNPEVRMQALELLTLGDRQAAIDRLALALSDPNPKISELAEDLLEELEQDLS